MEIFAIAAMAFSLFIFYKGLKNSSSSNWKKHEKQLRIQNKEIVTSRREANYMAPQWLQISADCAKLVKNTLKPDVFFSRFSLWEEMLTNMAGIESMVKFTGTAPSVILKHMQFERHDTISAFIKRYYEFTLIEISKLKMEYAKNNRAEKFKRALSKFYDKMNEDNIELCRELYAKIKPPQDVSFEEMANDTKNVIDLHFRYNTMIGETYKLREQGDNLEKCIEYCKKDIELFPALNRAFKKQYSQHEESDVKIPSFDRLSIIYEKQKKIEEAIHICELALSYNLKSFTAGGFEGRLERLKKKLDGQAADKSKDNAPSKPIENRRVVVSVDAENLERIRREAQITQEALTVTDYAEEEARKSVVQSDILGRVSQPGGNVMENPPEDEWKTLRASLSLTELNALQNIIARGSVKEFCATHGVMPEVLIDGINQKATDAVGDVIIDASDGVVVYDEYVEKVMEIIG